MNDTLMDDFIDTANALLIRNRSILDTISKFQITAAKVSRAVVKCATHCGCIEIDAKKQDYSNEDASLEDLRESMDTHIQGELCPRCREIIARELGEHLFYLASICNSLDLDYTEIIEKENQRMSTLGVFNLR